MGDFANCCYHNIFIFTARQKQCLPNKILDIQYNTVIIFLFMLLKIPSSVPGSINVYFPCLPFLYFFFIIWLGNEQNIMCVGETIFLKNFCCKRICDPEIVGISWTKTTSASRFHMIANELPLYLSHSHEKLLKLRWDGPMNMSIKSEKLI